MPEKLRYDARYKTKDSEVTATNVIVFFFKEDNAHIAYSPALDLSGYGYTEDEAKDSFEVALKQFIEITTKKNTLLSELKRLGWRLKGKDFKLVKAPPLEELLVSNASLAKLIEERTSFRMTVQPVQLTS